MARKVETFDLASLEAFTSSLVAAGFEPVPGSQRRWWSGPAHPAFASITAAQTMRVAISDGWPYRPPAVFVAGLAASHSTPDGLVCLWRDEDASLSWTSHEALGQRIEQWCHDAEHGWEDSDLGGDALLNYTPKAAVLASFDLAVLEVGGPGSWGDIHGVVRSWSHVELVPGRASSVGHLRGVRLHAGQLDLPPRRLDELRGCLNRSQWRGLQRMLAARRAAPPLVPSGGADLIMLSWQRRGRQDLLVLACRGAGDSLEAIALQPDPNDEKSLLLRAGPDAEILRKRSVVVFGAGALGGHLAVTLAESGIGALHLVDGDLLTFGNVVRHVAGRDAVGSYKVDAVKAVVSAHAPWSQVTGTRESPMTPGRIAELFTGADLVLDATGLLPVTYALSATAFQLAVPLVAGALYRGGAIGRVRRQGTPGDTPIQQRDASDRYPLIPPAEDGSDLAVPEVGCAAPVNNAPPTSVLACAALNAQAAIDLLTGRWELPDEVIDVYRALPTYPFDRIGRVLRP